MKDNIMYPEINLDIRPCFRMIVSHQIGEGLENNFEIMYPDFNRYINYHAITVNLLKFKNLLKILKLQSRKVDGFRVYLGRDENKSLVFIFTALEKDADVTVFYMLRQTGNFLQLTWDEASAVVSDYQENVLPYTETVVKENTKSYSFRDHLIDDFINELDFQTSDSPIDRVRVKLGAYISNDDYKNRIMIGFAFVNKEGNEIGLEEIGGKFGCQIILKSNAIGADTGTPCPPNNCNGTTLPKP